MTSPARKVSRLPPEQRITDITRAARSVFAEQGYDAASVAVIAERAGVVEGSVYRYFENKRALLVRVVEQWYEEMLADYDEHLKAIDGTWNRLRYTVWKHLSVIENDPAMCRLVFAEIRPRPEYQETHVFALNREYTKRTVAILKAGIAAGELRSDLPVGLVRDMIYGGIEHHTWAFLRGSGRFSADTACDDILRILRGGLTAEAPTPAGSGGSKEERGPRASRSARRKPR